MEVSGQLHAPAALPPGEELLRVVPRTGLDVVEKIKITCFRQESSPDPTTMLSIAYRYID
jgi:hypothetical protein